jgi:hypothetical protein
MTQRAPRRTTTVAALALLASCGGDATSPKDLFPDAAGVYEVNGTFDGISPSDAHFNGPLTLTQASRETGTLAGSAAYAVTIGSEVVNLNDDSISSAGVSPSGELTYTMGEGGSTWTFTGALSGTSIINGRHTLSEESGSASGAWSATRVSPSNVHHSPQHHLLDRVEQVPQLPGAVRHESEAAVPGLFQLKLGQLRHALHQAVRIGLP